VPVDEGRRPPVGRGVDRPGRTRFGWRDGAAGDLFEFHQQRGIADRLPIDVLELRLDDHDLGENAEHQLRLAQCGLRQSLEQRQRLHMPLDAPGVVGLGAAQDHVAGVHLRVGGQRPDVFADLRLVRWRQRERQLDDLLEVGLAKHPDGVLVGEILVFHRHRMFDDVPVGSEQENASGDIEEKFDRLEDLQRLLRQASVEIVDGDHQRRARAGDLHDVLEIVDEFLDQRDPGAVAADAAEP
jgi:hypothetical protein